MQNSLLFVLWAPYYLVVVRHCLSLHSAAYYTDLMPIVILRFPSEIRDPSSIIPHHLLLILHLIPYSSLFLCLHHVFFPFLLFLLSIAFIDLLLQCFPYSLLLCFFLLQHYAFLISTLEYSASLLKF